MPKVPRDFERNVFINCPYDDLYLPLFRSIVFTVHDMGFLPRCALEESNFTENRLDKIIKIISECRYSIHDLSRTELDSRDLPRFNMPLELGLDLGCNRFGADFHRKKIVLVLDIKKHRYRSFISDIAGHEVYAHGGSVKKAIAVVQEWLATAQPSAFPDSARIFRRYEEFQKALPRICKLSGLKQGTMPYPAFSWVVADWLNKNPRMSVLA